MKVPLIDLQAQYVSVRDSVREAVDRVFETQQFVMGPEVAALEAEVAAYCQTNEAIGCASGSDALLLALMALNVGPEDEVITTPFSFFATASAIARLGARPVFVDIDPLTYNLNVDAISGGITSRTRVVIPVHLYGQCAEMDEILSLCKAKVWLYSRMPHRRSALKIADGVRVRWVWPVVLVFIPVRTLARRAMLGSSRPVIPLLQRECEGYVYTVV